VAVGATGVSVGTKVTVGAGVAVATGVKVGRGVRVAGGTVGTSGVGVADLQPANANAPESTTAISRMLTHRRRVLREQSSSMEASSAE